MKDKFKKEEITDDIDQEIDRRPDMNLWEGWTKQDTKSECTGTDKDGYKVDGRYVKRICTGKLCNTYELH